MIRASSIAKEAVLAYVRACESVQRARDRVEQAQSELDAAEGKRTDLWENLKKENPPAGVYLFEGHDALILEPTYQQHHSAFLKEAIL